MFVFFSAMSLPVAAHHAPQGTVRATWSRRRGPPTPSVGPGRAGGAEPGGGAEWSKGVTDPQPY